MTYFLQGCLSINFNALKLLGLLRLLEFLKNDMKGMFAHICFPTWLCNDLFVT